MIIKWLDSRWSRNFLSLAGDGAWSERRPAMMLASSPSFKEKLFRHVAITMCIDGKRNNADSFGYVWGKAACRPLLLLLLYSFTRIQEAQDTLSYIITPLLRALVFPLFISSFFLFFCFSYTHSWAGWNVSRMSSHSVCLSLSFFVSLNFLN